VVVPVVVVVEVVVPEVVEEVVVPDVVEEAVVVPAVLDVELVELGGLWYSFLHESANNDM